MVKSRLLPATLLTRFRSGNLDILKRLAIVFGG